MAPASGAITPAWRQVTLDDSTNSPLLLNRIARNIGSVMRGQPASIRKLLAAFASGGHVLLEDIPGTGKTTLCKALAQSIDARFQRVQFTPDLLPTDILGVSVYDQHSTRFEFHAGPVFTDILLADEINRASPRTQSALLEAMAEAQVSVEGETRDLPPNFFVIATQNPIEYHGTYPLPEAQLDRFAMRFSLGYVDEDQEIGILDDQRLDHPLQRLAAVAPMQAFDAERALIRDIHCSAEIQRYMVQLVRATRHVEGVTLGASPRASLALMKCSQALARFDGLDFITPDHVQELAEPVLGHRISLDPQALYGGRSISQVVEEVLNTVAAPA